MTTFFFYYLNALKNFTQKLSTIGYSSVTVNFFVFGLNMYFILEPS